METNRRLVVAVEVRREKDEMGIRMSQGKNKKSPRPVTAVTVKREDALRQGDKAAPALNAMGP